MAEKNLTVRTNVGDQVIARVDELSKVGFTMPADYSYVNAIKASLLKLQEVKDKNGKPALEVCDQKSIQSALFEMATKGLDASKSQCYLIVRGDKLCLHESYFGRILEVKRIYPTFDPKPRVIYQDDVFEYATDINTGHKVLIKHEQKLENLDKDFVGAYMYIPTAEGGQDLFIMTKKMILAAWSKSSSRELATHKTFTDKMVSKTIISSACTAIINSTPALANMSDDINDYQPKHDNIMEEQPEFQEAEVVEDAPDITVNKETGEVKESPKNKAEKPKNASEPQPQENEEEPEF